MTVGKLKKILSKISDRTEVVVDKDSLWDGNKTFTICSVKSHEHEFVRLCDGDGFGLYNSKGHERGSFKLILKGGS